MHYLIFTVFFSLHNRNLLSKSHRIGYSGLPIIPPSLPHSAKIGTSSGGLSKATAYLSFKYESKFGPTPNKFLRSASLNLNGIFDT